MYSRAVQTRPRATGRPRRRSTRLSHPARTVTAVTPAYGLDVETDTARGGLDPRRCRILAAAVAMPTGVAVFTGAERIVLARLDAALAELEPGVIVTWNGSCFDLPFLAERARRQKVDIGLRLALDATIVLTHPPLAGHPGAYRAGWHGHRHLDAYRAYKALEPGPCALKAVAARRGLAVVDADPARVHELRTAELRRYVARDAELAVHLALARGAELNEFIDPPVSGRAA